MKGVIRVGDTHTGRGVVLDGSPNMMFMGIKVARKGDPVTCPIIGHGRNVIAEGHPLILDNGIPVAFHGHRCACGCVLISSLPLATVT